MPGTWLFEIQLHRRRTARARSFRAQGEMSERDTVCVRSLRRVAALGLRAVDVHAQAPSGIALSANELAMVRARGSWPRKRWRDASN
jgi:hypothetical protein